MKKHYLLVGLSLMVFYSGIAHSNTEFVSIKKADYKDSSIGANLLNIYTLIQGQILDENGIPIPGANVLATVNGKIVGVVTDFDGNYSIDVPDDVTTLEFSFLGYETQVVNINGRQTINITLTPATTSLDEVVVTALGITKAAKSLGYSVGKVTGDELSTNRSANFMNAAQGKVAGVNITAVGTGPAGTSKVRIRGQSSFGGSNSPLIVVNGIPIDNSNFGVGQGDQGSGGSQDSGAVADGGDGLSSINPDDIESMTILKGAAASALYGSRAKDGVIMIVTKSKGTEGIQVEYNANVMTHTPQDFTDYQYEYGQGEHGIRPTTPNPTSGVWSFGEKFEPGMTQILFDGIEVPYTPVRDRVRKFYDNGLTVSNTISIASGGENGGLRLSLGNMDNKGIVPGNEFKRQNADLGFTYSSSDKFTVSGNINYSHQKVDNAPTVVTQDLSTPTVIYSLSNSMPFDLLESQAEDENGNERIYSRFRNRTNPYFTVNNAFNNIEKDRIFGNITARYNLTDWLYTQVRAGQDYYSRRQEHNTRPTGAAALAPAPEGFFNGRYRQDAQQFRETNLDFMIGANKDFGDFGIDVIVGGNQMHRRSENRSDAVQDFKVRGLYTIDNGRVTINGGAVGTPRFDYLENSVNSLFGAAEINYKGFVYLNATVRKDWFSTLSKENRGIPYPSITGSFVFSEAFTMPEFINFGKIRAAYAEVGSDTDVGPFANRLFYGTNPSLFNGQTVGNIGPNVIPNPELKPMRVSEYEFGFETRMFQSKVGLEISYYNKLSRDQILTAQISTASGYSSQLINIGESKNQGVEMLLSLKPIKTDNFDWNFVFNGSYNTSEVLSLGTEEEGTSITVSQGEARGAQLRHVVGQPIGQLYGFGYLRDASGNQVFDETSGVPLRTSDRISFGSAIPTWVGGFTNTFNYKAFSFSFLIDFKLGHNLISTTNFNAWRHGLHKGTLVGREANEVVGVGVNPNGNVNTTPAELQTFYEVVRGQDLMEEFAYDAGFWKLRQLSLGYDFTKHLATDSFISGLKFDIIASNVFIIKKWAPNIDPEQTGFASDNLNGIEDPALPSTRNIGFNLNVKF